VTAVLTIITYAVLTLASVILISVAVAVVVTAFLKLRAAYPHLKAPLRFCVRAGVAALVLNEVRGIVTVAATAPVWWSLIVGMFHAALRGH
jgi:hypothetical protein